MPNFNSYKTTNQAYFPRPNGPGTPPAWDLSLLANAWNALVDFVALLWATVRPADETAPDPVALSPTTSPYMHLAEESQILYISGDGITEIALHRESDDTWVPVTTAAFADVYLEPGRQVRVAWEGATPPSIVQDVSNWNNASGVTEVLVPDESPYTVEAGGRAAVVYISGGAIDSIKRNGVSLGSAGVRTVPLPRGGAVVIEYNEAGEVPYIVRQT